MARPVDTAKRDELALAAFEVIRERGAQQVTMTALAEALGMKRPTLYWYFSDLGQVLEAVLTLTLRRQAQALAPRLMGPIHPVDRLARYIEGVHSYFEDHADSMIVMFQLWAGERDERQQHVLAMMREYFLPLRDGMRDALVEGMRDGRVAPCDPDAVVDLITALTDGVIVHRVSRGMTMAPVRQLAWQAVLAPLKRTPEPTGGPR